MYYCKRLGQLWQFRVHSNTSRSHNDRYALRAKVNAENYGFKDGCWWTLNNRLRSIKATTDQHRWNWKGSWCSCDVNDDITNNDNNNHREENGTYIWKGARRLTLLNTVSSLITRRTSATVRWRRLYVRTISISTGGTRTRSYCWKKN